MLNLQTNQTPSGTRFRMVILIAIILIIAAGLGFAAWVATGHQIGHQATNQVANERLAPQTDSLSVATKQTGLWGELPEQAPILLDDRTYTTEVNPTTVEVIGRSQDSTMLQVKFGEEQTGWVLATDFYQGLTGSTLIESLPVIEPPIILLAGGAEATATSVAIAAAPTITPTATATTAPPSPTPTVQASPTPEVKTFINSNGTITVTMIVTDTRLVNMGVSQHFTVTTEAMNLRAGPNVKYPSLATVKKGQVFSCIGRNAAGTWCLTLWQLDQTDQAYTGPAWISLKDDFVDWNPHHGLENTQIFQDMGMGTEFAAIQVATNQEFIPQPVTGSGQSNEGASLDEFLND